MSVLDQRFRDHLTCVGLVASVFLYGRQQYIGATTLLAFSALMSINPSEVLQSLADYLKPYLYHDLPSDSGTSESSRCSSSTSQGLACFEPMLASKPEYGQLDEQSSD
jgi:hypothetical protein